MGQGGDLCTIWVAWRAHLTSRPTPLQWCFSDQKGAAGTKSDEWLWDMRTAERTDSGGTDVHVVYTKPVTGCAIIRGFMVCVFYLMTMVNIARSIPS